MITYAWVCAVIRLFKVEILTLLNFLRCDHCLQRQVSRDESWLDVACDGEEGRRQEGGGGWGAWGTGGGGEEHAYSQNKKGKKWIQDCRGGGQPDKTGRRCGTESLASSDFQDIKIGLATIAELHYELPRKLLSLPPLMKFMKLFLLPFAPRPNPARLSAPFPAYTTRLTHCTHACVNPKGPDYEAIIDAPLPLSLSATANAPSVRPLAALPLNMEMHEYICCCRIWNNLVFLLLLSWFSSVGGRKTGNGHKSLSS